MRHTLLKYLACPYCHAPLACHVHREVQHAAAAPSANGASPAAEAEIAQGLLVCNRCSRWFPIVDQLPEILPDHLRDRARDTALFREYAGRLPPDARTACERFVPGTPAPEDRGAHHKAAEIGLAGKVDDPGFFGPGYSSPFNPGNTAFTLYLVQLFGAVAPLLDARAGDAVLDSGSGYSWTTEWLFRSGIDAIGVDICRAYLDIAVARMGPSRPHLVVADVEHLPIASGKMRAVLGYESFHHIPDRRRAVRGYARVLEDGGRLVLAEPGAAHEAAEGSVEVMKKYGILEKGMELADVGSYASGTAFGDPEQIFLVHARHRDLSRRVVEIARTGSPVDGNIFLLRKGEGARDAAQQPAEASKGPAPVGDRTATAPGHASAPGTDGALDGAHFDAHYYANCCGQPYCRNAQWLQFFGSIADRIKHDILDVPAGTERSPARVLDAGCAIGLLVETLRDRGIDASGLDISEYAIGNADERVRPHLAVGSITAELHGRYDLIVSIEVLEHMPEAEADAAIANFCRHADDILFSSSPTDYGEATHVNVHPPEHWAELFARHGFLRDVEFDASFITPWAVRYRRRAEPLTRVVRDYERAFARAAIERNELRAQVLRFDREIIVAATEAPRLRDELASVNRQLRDAQIERAQLTDRIFHMERSFFWRLRGVWASVRALARSR